MAWAPAGRFRPFCSEQLLRTVPQLQATALIHTRAVVTDGPRGHSSYEDQSLAKGRCCSGVSGNVIERGHIWHLSEGKLPFSSLLESSRRAGTRRCVGGCPGLSAVGPLLGSRTAEGHQAGGPVCHQPGLLSGERREKKTGVRRGGQGEDNGKESRQTNALGDKEGGAGADRGAAGRGCRKRCSSQGVAGHSLPRSRLKALPVPGLGV